MEARNAGVLIYLQGRAWSPGSVRTSTLTSLEGPAASCSMESSAVVSSRLSFMKRIKRLLGTPAKRQNLQSPQHDMPHSMFVIQADDQFLVL